MKVVHERSMRNSLRNLHRAINNNNMAEVRQNVRLGFNLDNFYNGSIASQVALKKGNFEVCSLLFHNGADVNLQIEDGNTLLHHSLEGNIDLDKVHFLLENGADPDIANYFDQTPLHVICERGEVEVARMLIDKSVYVNRCDSKGETALVKSSRRGHERVVKILVGCGADMEWKDNEGCTSLMRAVEERQNQVVKVLLEAGCDSNTYDKYHTTPLMTAARNDDVINMEILIQHGAHIDMCDLRKQTAFTEAVTHLSLGAVTLLMQRSCDVNMTSFSLKQTALHHCINKSTQAHGQREKHRDLINKFLAYEATHIDTLDQSGCSPLYLACLYNLQDVAENLMSHGACKKTTTNNNHTLMHACAFSNCVPVALSLIEEAVHTDTPTIKNESPLYLAVLHKADSQIILDLLSKVKKVNRQEESKGHTALHAAVLNSNKWVVEALLQAGCDVNITDKSNRTALWHACDVGDEEVVGVLLGNGVVEVGRGEDVLYVAVRRKKMRMVKMLLDARVPINRFSEGFKTPLYEATEQNHLHLLCLLLQHGANPSAHHSLSRFCGCCSRYTDPHPHLELHPLFAAVQNDNIKACAILVKSCHHHPLPELTTLRDIIFRTNYVTDAKLARKSVMQFAAFFAHVMGAPRTLKEVCRGVLRGMLGEYSAEKVDALLVPDGVKHFLNLRHLDVVIKEHT